MGRVVDEVVSSEFLARALAQAPAVVVGMHPATAAAYCGLLERSLTMVLAREKELDARHADVVSLVRSGGVGSDVSGFREKVFVEMGASSSGRSSSAFTGSSTSSKRRRRAWAARERAKLGCFLEDGKCYLRLVIPSERSGVATQLGLNPTLMQVMQLPERVVVPDEWAAALSIVHREPSGYHVTVGSEGWPVKEFFSSAAVSCVTGPGTLGRRWGRAGIIHHRFEFSAPVGSIEAVRVYMRERVNGLEKSTDEDFLVAGLHLACKSQALLGARDKQSLRALEGVGDAVLTLALAEVVQFGGRSVQALQEMRSQVTNNSYLALRLEGSGLAPFVDCVGALHTQPRTAASALEAMIAVVYRLGGMCAALVFIQRLDLFPDCRGDLVTLIESYRVGDRPILGFVRNC